MSDCGSNPCTPIGVNGGPGSGGGLQPGQSSWSQILEVDFSLWAATDFATGGDGVYALNGGSGALNWTVSSSANANAGSAANGGFFRRNAADVGDDGASGLRIFHDQNVTSTLSRATQTSPRVQISMATLLSGTWDPTRSYRFELHVTRFLDNNPANAFGTAPAAVMALFGAAASPTGSTARFGGVQMARNGSNDASPSVLAGNVTALPITAFLYSTGTDVMAMSMAGVAQTTVAYSGQYGTAWPLSTTLRALGATQETVDNNAGNAMSDQTMLLEIGNAERAVQTGTVDIMFRRLRVLIGP